MVEDIIKRKIRKHVEDLILWYIDGRGKLKIKGNIIGDWKVGRKGDNMAVDLWIQKVIKVKEENKKRKIIEEIRRIQGDIEKGKMIRTGVAWTAWKIKENGDIMITIATDSLFLYEVGKRDNKKIINKVWKSIEKNMKEEINRTIREIEKKWPDLLRRPKKGMNSVISMIVYDTLWKKIVIYWKKGAVCFHILGSNGSDIIEVKYREVKAKYNRKFIKLLKKIDERLGLTAKTSEEVK